jgi:hypothetical protein
LHIIRLIYKIFGSGFAHLNQKYLNRDYINSPMKHLIALFAFIVCLVYVCTGFHFEALFNLLKFFDFKSLIIVLVPAVFFCVSATSIKNFISAILSILGKKPFKEQETIEALRIFGNIALFCGILGLLAYTIITVQDKTTPKQLMLEFFVVFIPLFYGTIVKFICVVTQNTIQTKSTVKDEID